MGVMQMNRTDRPVHIPDYNGNKNLHQIIC